MSITSEWLKTFKISNRFQTHNAMLITHNAMLITHNAMLITHNPMK